MRRTLAFLAIVACGRAEPTPAPSTAPSTTSSASAYAAAGADADAAPSAGADAGADAYAVAIPEDMLPVPGGTFTMGADKGGEEDERPAHEVTLVSFLLDKTEVTHEAYDACVAAKACRPKSPSISAGYPKSQGSKHPVNGVAWEDAKAYCTWKGKRLPREAEFERAVRDGDGRKYPWGNDPPTPERTVSGRAMQAAGANTTDDVATHPAGRGPYGHDDLAGNVWEWMEDEYDPFAYARAGAPKGEPGTCAEIVAAQDKLRKEGRQGFTGSNPIPDECEHSIRGGAFNFPAEGLRSTNRVHHAARFRIVMLGFRCAKDAPRSER